MSSLLSEKTFKNLPSSLWTRGLQPFHARAAFTNSQWKWATHVLKCYSYAVFRDKRHHPQLHFLDKNITNNKSCLDSGLFGPYLPLLYCNKNAIKTKQLQIQILLTIYSAFISAYSTVSQKGISIHSISVYDAKIFGRVTCEFYWI